MIVIGLDYELKIVLKTRSDNNYDEIVCEKNSKRNAINA